MQHRNGYRHRARGTALTDLERTILRAYARGMRRAEIACEVGLADRTVGAYLTAVKEKLGARNLAHAAALCVADGEG